MNTYVEDLVLLSLTWIPFSFIIFLRKKNNILVQEVLVLVLVQSILWCIVQKPNSWTYNHGEVFGHDLDESAQTQGFCMDFLNHSEGGMVFYQVFLLSPWQKRSKRFREFEEIEISSKAVDVTVNNKKFVVVYLINIENDGHVMYTEGLLFRE